MDLPLSNFRHMAVEEFDTSKLLAHAARQASERGYKNFPIVDVDSHHYELESLGEILEFMDDPVIQQLAQSANQSGMRHTGVFQGGVGYQDMGGRVMRYALRKIEKTAGDPAPRHHAQQALDGRHGRRRGGDVPHPDAHARPASADRGRGGDGARL